MILRIYFRSWTALIAIFFATLGIAADEPETRAKPLTPAQCERLVEQLANPNEKPFDNYVRRLPVGLSESTLFDRQRPIASAYNELSTNIEASLPILMEHVSDKRFSYVYEDFAGGYECMTIGGACTEIIVEHVDAYRKAVTKYDREGRSRSLSFINHECGGIAKWWKD